MASKVVFGSSNKVVFGDAKQIVDFLLPFQILGAIVEVVVALVGAIVKDKVVILGGLGGVRVNREQLMAGKEEFD